MAGQHKPPWGAVVCEKHGTVSKDDDSKLGVKWVKVPIPSKKKARLYGGCPHCKRER